MDAKVWRLIDLIPDRVARAGSGVVLAGVNAESCVHPERVALLSEFLHWLSPLYPTTREDQTRLGLFASKQAQAEEEEETEDLEEETVV